MISSGGSSRLNERTKARNTVASVRTASIRPSRMSDCMKSRASLGRLLLGVVGRRLGTVDAVDVGLGTGRSISARRCWSRATAAWRLRRSWFTAARYQGSDLTVDPPARRPARVLQHLRIGPGVVGQGVGQQRGLHHGQRAAPAVERVRAGVGVADGVEAEHEGPTRLRRGSRLAG